MTQNQQPDIRLFHPRSPSLTDFAYEYDKIKKRAIFSNNGPVANEFEKHLGRICTELSCAITNSGTSALEAIFRCYKLAGNVITTPFSYVATAHAAKACHLEVRYASVEDDSLNIDVNSIEELVDEDTSAIIAVHTYGHPCAVEKLQALASRYGLKLIFDAAQAFGTQIDGVDLAHFGDASAYSFHATKVLSAVEGGAVFSKDAGLIDRIREYRQFGIDKSGSVIGFGLNAKMSELHALVGLDNLTFLADDLISRKNVLNWYQKYLISVEGISLHYSFDSSTNYNGAYCPIEVSEPIELNEFVEYLKSNGIQAKRYFYPLLTSFPDYENSLKSTKDIPKKALRMVCLPIHPFLKQSDIKYIAEIINDFISHNTRR